MIPKKCAVCGKTLEPQDIKIVERRSTTKRRNKYLCQKCRKTEYNQYLRSIKEIID